MKAIEPAELSAYLDGELSGDRAAEVQMALDSDDKLRSKFEHLKRMNAEWKSAAATGAFNPTVKLETKTSWLESPLIMAVAIILLVTLRIAPKLADLFVGGLVIHVVSLAVAMTWIVRIARVPK